MINIKNIYLIALKIVNAKDKKANVLKPVCPFEETSSWQTLVEDASLLAGKKTILGSSDEAYCAVALVSRL